MVNIYMNKKYIGSSSCLSYEALEAEVCNRTNLHKNEFYMQQNGKNICESSIVDEQFNVCCFLKIFGGKGGFGSMLRAIGAQIEKTTNREACRDLSGRRLRDINEEKRLKAWLDGQKDREREAEEKKARKIEKLLHVPKHQFKDEKYEETRSKMTEKVSDAVEEGFKKSQMQDEKRKQLKRTAESSSTIKNGPKAKKASLWIADDISDSGSGSDSGASDEEKKEK